VEDHRAPYTQIALAILVLNTSSGSESDTASPRAAEFGERHLRVALEEADAGARQERVEGPDAVTEAVPLGGEALAGGAD
jgi:hypothetical protein